MYISFSDFVWHVNKVSCRIKKIVECCLIIMCQENSKTLGIQGIQQVSKEIELSMNCTCPWLLSCPFSGYFQFEELLFH